MPYEKRASVLQLGESTENTFFGCLGWLRILFKLENLLLVDLFSNKTKKHQAHPKILIQIYNVDFSVKSHKFDVHLPHNKYS